MNRALLLSLLLAATPVPAQEGGSVLIVPPEEDGTLFTPLTPRDGEGRSILEPDLDLRYVPDRGAIEETQRIETAKAQGATVRGLDRLSNAVVDMELAPGQTGAFGHLQVTLGECRYPAANPSGDAFAYLVIREDGKEAPVFAGWMIASAPALNAMDDPRYDVWVLRCKIS